MVLEAKINVFLKLENKISHIVNAHYKNYEGVFAND